MTAHPIPRSEPGDVSLLTADDLYLFNEGTHTHLYEKLGAHLMSVSGREGAYFAVWAPEAERVSVIGDFNDWDPGSAVLRPKELSGIWEGFLAGVKRGALYKFHIVSRHRGYRADKSDPFAFFDEPPPRTAAIVWDLAYEWGDASYLEERGARNARQAPMSIYEMHLGSWMRTPDGRWLSYRDLAPRLADYIRRLNFTHVEFLPVMEHLSLIHI